MSMAKTNLVFIFPIILIELFIIVFIRCKGMITSRVKSNTDIPIDATDVTFGDLSSK